MKRATFIIVAVAGAMAWFGDAPVKAQQSTFATPQEAAQALVDAAAQNDNAALLRLFGPDGKDIVQSGDAAADKRMRDEFVARAHARMQVESATGNPDFATVVVGDNDWPLPIPLVRKGGKWFFDAAQGRMQILARHIGRNELTAIDVCRGYVEAQMEYAAHAHDGSTNLKYAQKIISTPGKQDGLYWEGESNKLVPKSFGDAGAVLVQSEGKNPVPYHGYYFHVLKAQGPDAPGGAMDYVVKGQMIGGFALVAWPAEYGVSGVKTYVVNQMGTVYDKDLGGATPTLARAMTRFNPDKTWTAVQGE